MKEQANVDKIYIRSNHLKQTLIQLMLNKLNQLHKSANLLVTEITEP